MAGDRLITASEWARLQEIFDAASDLPPAARAKFLDQQCGTQTRLRAQVESLLSWMEGDSAITSAVENAVASVANGPQALGNRIGPYELIRLLGRGGMGAVYLASRADDQYRKEVAIKLIHPGFASPEMTRRFRAERQILANLEHPNIARLLDGGTTGDDAPYVVMEYVYGKPIDRYCEEKSLSITDRLRLFQSIAKAIQYAHQNVIVHRDIKPGNILVTDSGEPKLLDFGIAKLLGTDPDASITAAGDRVMTPEYASPEQIRGEPITTGADIYSLGVLLYELLTGERPFHFTGTAGQLERDICEREPEKPSRVPGSVGWSDDLDRIVLKALDKDPGRRYASAAEFSDDVERYLSGFPVIARPNSWTYLTGKFVRRHRVGVAAAALFLLMLLGFAVGMEVLARRAREEARTAGQVTDFVVNLFQSNDPETSQGAATSARELLDRGAARLDNQLKDDPEVQARLFDTVGGLYDSLGVWPQAERLLGRSLDLREHKLRRDDLAIANTLHQLGGVSSDLSKFPQAEAAYREALRLYQAKLGNENLKVAAAQNDLATILVQQGRTGEAETLTRQSLDMNIKLGGAKSEESLRAMNNLSFMLGRRGDFAGAENYARQLLNISIETAGTDQVAVVFGGRNRASYLESLGRFSEAETEIRRAIAVSTKLYGKDHPSSVAVRTTLASILTRSGKVDEARGIAAQAVTQDLKTLGPRNLETAYAQDCLGAALLAAGEIEPARRLFNSALEARLALTRPNNSAVAGSWMSLGDADRAAHALPQAAIDVQRALDIRKESFGPDSIFAAASETALAEILVEQGGFRHAEELARHALSTNRANLPLGHIATGAAESALGWLWSKQGRYTEARPLLEDAYSIAQHAYGAPHIETARAAIRLAVSLSALGASDAAVNLVRINGPILDRSPDSSSRQEKTALRDLRRKLP